MDKATNRPSPELARVGPDMARLEKKLADLGLHRIVRLDHAQVFVGEVRPAALRAISELPWSA